MFYHLIAYYVSRLREKAEENSGEPGDQRSTGRAINQAKRTVGNNIAIENLAKYDPKILGLAMYILFIIAILCTIIVVIWGEEINKDTFPAGLVIVLFMCLFVVLTSGCMEAIIVFLRKDRGYENTFQKEWKEDSQAFLDQKPIELTNVPPT